MLTGYKGGQPYELGFFFKGLFDLELDGLRWDFGYAFLMTHLIMRENVVSRHFLIVISVISGFNISQSWTVWGNGILSFVSMHEDDLFEYREP